MERIEIPLSKTKIFLLLAGSVVFVVIGLLFAIEPDRFVTPILRSPGVVRIAGIAAVLFFGATGIYGARKIFDKTPGLIIDEKGIFDNSNATSIGLIPWSEITAINTAQVMSTKFLLIFTRDPELVMQKVTGIKRKLMASNWKMFGTPISITSTALKYDFEKLEVLLRKKLQEYGDRTG